MNDERINDSARGCMRDLSGAPDFENGHASACESGVVKTAAPCELRVRPVRGGYSPSASASPTTSWRWEYSSR